ncbi:uncharacterized protein TNCV_3044691 [Trichonephila clavipes]|nr:uncharacterized protein TNCV_3044691 [Trichonephila clavipes]
MRNKEDILIKDLLLEEMAIALLEQSEFLRNDAKKNIENLQSENTKTYNRRRKKSSLYKEGDLVAIQRTQFGAGLKLRPKFLGPYKVTKVNSKDRYEVEKVGQHEGPNSTTTSDEAAVAEWYRYRIVACLVTSSIPVLLKTRRVGQRCTLNLSRAETSSRWCGVVVRRGECQLRCRPRHLTMVQNYVVRRQKPSCS